MGLFNRRAQASRDYPAAGASVTGRADRFIRAKTTGARRAAAQGQAWEDRDRAQDRKGRWYRAAR
ncbi:hypothetical protein CFC35_05665 [Streptomyces sp. FBKL.4005]|uniref:Uncharacterized protein n=1 Tax=Streptomyces tricolor TaxID=68277 RepID=A0ABS9JHH6_9ACTN|nr:MULTISPECIES: hypothetical protein [Streptomyces]MCG0065008.1 hypothetical protein [Streptomyces tricolor]OYP14052.1 hypothetical protein CFC35_05665 [Streptomyces sp. FBKL.4005]BCM70886.1 hypothetical protein EASAB2608_06220 [Streptomyces sp. EAS-AB2608]